VTAERESGCVCVCGFSEAHRAGAIAGAKRSQIQSNGCPVRRPVVMSIVGSCQTRAGTATIVADRPDRAWYSVHAGMEKML